MEDNLRSHTNPMLIERTPLNDIRLQRIIDHRYQLEGKRLEDCGWRNAVCEEIVKFGADFEDLGR